MSEAILFNVAESLLTNLGSRALDEVASTWGFKSHLEKLKNTINTIKDVMLDAENRQFESHAVRGWLDRLKTVMFAADDLFDEFATIAAQRTVRGTSAISKEVLNFFSSSNQIGFAFSISSKIKKIREELDDIVKDSSEFAFVLRPHEEGRLSRQVRDQTHSFVNADEVIGRDNDRDAIIDIMMASLAAQEQRLCVIPIVGIGGLGKTTLAQLICNNEWVEKHFELKLWACVSDFFDVKEVIKKILMSATNTESRNLEIDQLQGQLRKEIGRKKYFLVLDDVWNEKPEEWLNLSAILKVGGEGSTILVTTRSRKVAHIMGTVPAYDLGGLLEENSWTLFEKLAFEPGESQKKPQLLKLGKEIVKKCADVPLALRTVGTLLRGNEEWKWISIADDSSVELPDKQNNIMAILKLSYNHLSSPLKNCFAYCALFPKDYEFDKETLIDLWMAEGFVVPESKTPSLRELGDEYLLLLLQRCFFQDIKRNEWGAISSCKMHDLMHDLALEVAGLESKMVEIQDINFSERFRHLSFGYQLTQSWKIPACMLKAKHLRTFLLPKQFRDGSNFNKAFLQQIISNFTCMRVLDLRNLGLRTLPKSIGKLIHLRYLNLSMNPIEELPNSITRLHNLQSLILYHCLRLKALPIHIRKLANLRSLNVDECHYLTHMPRGLGELTSLHKLPMFLVNHRFSQKFICKPATAHLRDLKALNNLRGSLEIKLFEDLEDPASQAKEASLNSKHGLTELLLQLGGKSYDDVNVKFSNHDEAVLEGLKPHQNLKKLEIYWYRGQKLPSWLLTDSLCITLPNLVEICLLRCGRCRQVPSFSQLPFLRCLSLFSLESVEYMESSLHRLQSSPSAETFFPSLRELSLFGMDSLKGWWEETEAIDRRDQEAFSHQSSQCLLLSSSFANLAKLQIEDCPNLALFPLSPNVEELVLKNVNKHLTVLKKLTRSTISDHVGSSVTKSGYNSKLKILSVDEIEDLISLPEQCFGEITSLDIQDSKLLNTSRLEEVFKRLSSLSCLEFTHCESLKSVSEGLQHLTSLDSLVIWNCEELDLSQNDHEDGMPWKALKMLRSLQFHMIPKLVHLPSGLRHLTTLRTLIISCNDNLATLPQWVSCFSSLEYVQLLKCPKLTCLPEEFSKLISLNELEIEECQGLTKRCQGTTGSDWAKIQHIPLRVVRHSHRD